MVRGMRCNGCLIQNRCYGYDPSGRRGLPDEMTCRIYGTDCSGRADDSGNII